MTFGIGYIVFWGLWGLFLGVVMGLAIEEGFKRLAASIDKLHTTLFNFTQLYLASKRYEK